MTAQPNPKATGDLTYQERLQRIAASLDAGAKLAADTRKRLASIAARKRESAAADGLGRVDASAKSGGK